MKHKTTYRVNYGDTDKMGVVYYANYLRIYEIARNEFMHAYKIPFSLLEEKGYACPAVDVKIRYLKPAIYDQLLTVVTRVKETPKARFSFYQEIINSNNEVMNIAEIDLCFVLVEDMTPKRCPQFLLKFFAGE